MKPKIKKYLDKDVNIIELEVRHKKKKPAEEQLEEEEKRTKKIKTKDKIKKPITMSTKDGKKVQIVDVEEEPSSEEEIDKRTGKPIHKKKKPRKKQIINEDGDIEEVEEIIESSVESEYDEETGEKKPKIRKYKNKK